MTTAPVFPLNTVIFPGTATSLHIFEERYRTLVADLLARPNPADRVFVVVAIREGYEVAAPAAGSTARFENWAVHRIGTLVRMTSTTPYPDGRYDIAVTGLRRVVLDAVDLTGPYARAALSTDVDIHWQRAAMRMPGGVIGAMTRTAATYDRYRDRLAAVGGPVLPEVAVREPEELSYSLASAALLGLPQRQALLEQPEVLARLDMLRRILVEELRCMRAVPSVPISEVARTRWSPN